MNAQTATYVEPREDQFWDCFGVAGHPCAIRDRLTGKTVAKVLTSFKHSRLIAAAPDLLAALAELIAIDELMVLVGGTEGPVAHEHIEQAARRRLPAIEAARAAIAKATGGAA